MSSLVELFCHVDDCCAGFVPVWQRQMVSSGLIQRQRARQLCLREMMTILILFHQSNHVQIYAHYPLPAHLPPRRLRCVRAYCIAEGGQ